MNAFDRALQSAFKQANRISGRDCVANTGEIFTAQVEDVPMLQEPNEIAQAKSPVYTRVHVLAGSVANPRSVTTVTERGTNRSHRVIKFEETSMNNWTWVWMCEAQRI